MKRIVRGLKTVGPYMAVELLLPGGTLIALLMWLAESRRSRVALGPRR